MSVAPPASKRLDFIDLLRGWAVIVMIETHVFNATLIPSLRDGDLFKVITFLNGLVAPSFLFASGLAYAVTTRRKLNDYLAFGKPLVKQFQRLLLVLSIGYVLHIPKFNYAQLLSTTEEHAWRVFFQADVLQCIAVSLMAMQGLLLVLRTELRFYTVVGVVALAVIFLTPVIWGIDFWPLVPMAVAGYMNGAHFQNFPGFPLFPWAGFVFAGAAFGYWYLRSKDARSESLDSEGSMMKRALVAAGILMALSFAIEPLASSLYLTYDYWRFSPSFTLLRIGIVMMLCAGMFFYERNRGVSPGSPVTLIGRESLIVYTTHLLLIYGNFSTFNFSKRVHHSFGYGEAALTTVILLVLMYLLARFWSTVKQGSRKWKLALEVGTLIILVGVFFFGPGE